MKEVEILVKRKENEIEVITINDDGSHESIKVAKVKVFTDNGFLFKLSVSE